MHMNIFGIPEAKYFCSQFKKTPATLKVSVAEHISTVLQGVRTLKEGTVEFDAYRDCALRDVERNLFLAVSNYRRSLDLMMPGAASWAHVTLYYSSFFSARVLIGLFGGLIGRDLVVEVQKSQPGTQEL